MQTELRLRETLNDKQIKIILALQDELRNAKTILLSPRLRSKITDYSRSMTNAEEMLDSRRPDRVNKSPIKLQKIEERRVPREDGLKSRTPKGQMMKKSFHFTIDH
jgi:hypothetical protein